MRPRNFFVLIGRTPTLNFLIERKLYLHVIIGLWLLRRRKPLIEETYG